MTGVGLAALAACAVVGNQRWATRVRHPDDVRRTGRGRTDPRPRDGAAGRPRTARRRLADGRAQHRPQLTTFGGDRPGAHDRPDRGGRGRRDRDLAEGVGLGRGERWQPVRPDPRARRRGPRDQPVGGGPAASARRRGRRRRAARVRRPGERPQLPGHGDGHRRTRPGDRPRHREREPGRPRARQHAGQHHRGRRPRRARRRHGHGDVPRDRRRRRCGSPAPSARAA